MASTKAFPLLKLGYKCIVFEYLPMILLLQLSFKQIFVIVKSLIDVCKYSDTIWLFLL